MAISFIKKPFGQMLNFGSNGVTGKKTVVKEADHYHKNTQFL